jgi:osmotically-inducible protein OsmY
MFKLLIGAAIGGAAIWFLDPERGGGRRTQALGIAQKGKQRVTEKVGSDTPDRQERAPAGERLNDPGLQAKVESEIFRADDAPKDKVSVNVEDGVVYLRGELDDPVAIEGLREAASNVDGVTEVRSLLHETGEPAPAKEEAGA